MMNAERERNRKTNEEKNHLIESASRLFYASFYSKVALSMCVYV